MVQDIRHGLLIKKQSTIRAKCVHIGSKIIMKCPTLGQFTIQLERTLL